MNIGELKLENLFNRLSNSALFKDSFWALMGSVIGRGLSLAAGIYIARLLGKDLYGEYGVIKNTLIDISILSTFGLGYTCTKYIADYKSNNTNLIRAVVSKTMYITFVTSGFMAILLFLLASQIALYLEAPHLTPALRLLSIIIIFNAISTTQLGILSGFNAFKSIAKNNILSGLATLISSTVLTYYAGLNGALAALLISQIINCLLNEITVRKHILPYKIIKSKDSQLSKSLIGFSFPVALQEALYSLASWSGIILLVKFSNYGEVAINTVVAQWTSIILFVPGVLRNVCLSHLSGSTNDSNHQKNVMKAILAANFSTTFIAFIIVLIFSNYITSMYGDTFVGLKRVLNISVFYTIFNSLASVYIQEYISKGKNWTIFFAKLFREISVLVITYALLVHYKGEESGAYLYAISTLAMTILFFAFLILDNKYHRQ